MRLLTEELVYEVIQDAGPTFRNAEDKIAFAVHATLTASGFRLHATGSRATTNDVYFSSSLEEVGIENWNQYKDYYAFIYSNPQQGTKKIAVKAFEFCRKLIVDAYREGDSQPGFLEISIKEYVPEKEGNYPYLKDFGKLVGYIEKELVNKYGGCSAIGSSSDRKHQSRWPGGNGDVHPDLKRPGVDSGGDVHPDLKLPRVGSNGDVLPDLKRPGVGSGGDVHPDLKRPGAGSGADVQPDLKSFLGMILTPFLGVPRLIFRCIFPKYF